MKRLISILATAALLLTAYSCGKDNPTPEPPEEEEKTVVDEKTGTDYIYDLEALPELHLSFRLDEWNSLLQKYDRNHNTDEQVKCDVRFLKGEDEFNISDAGIRLKGNTSRRRPEGNDGQMHVKDKADWHHCHFQLNLRKFVKDDEHKIKGVKKIALKWFKDDPMYVRELYCYDLFRRAGVWTASNSSYCRLFIHVEGDAQEAYYGIYDMIEPVDDDFLKGRKEQFADAKGNLWKCRYGATLNDTNADIGADLDDGVEHTYELKTNTDELSSAKAQLQDFITNIRSRSGEDFKTWFSAHCDVDLLLLTYAVNVACGMWDDYWNNCNNYYIYFNSTAKDSYKFYLIPYDYDNTLGTSAQCGVQSDAGRHDPFNWGDSNKNPLIYKVLQIPEYKEIYRQHLLNLCAASSGLLYYDSSMTRIRQWHKLISPYIYNDTGEDCVIEDKPAYWGNHSEYRLLELGSNNYFQVKTSSIKTYCK